MFPKNLMNISDFAKMSGLSRQTLIYYDKIGLFSPSTVAENKYRMYSHNQIETISAITMLRDLGVPLEKIKSILSNISPQTTTELLEAQLCTIEKEISKLLSLQEMVRLRLQQIQKGIDALENNCEFFVNEFACDAPIFVSEELNCAPSDINDDMFIRFFQQTEQNNLPSVFTLGCIRKTDFVGNKRDVASQLFCRVQDEKYANAFIPAGTYAIGYGRGDPGDNTEAYEKMAQFVAQNGLEQTGEIYEEYLIDELAEKNPENYVFQLAVRVKKKQNNDN